MTPNRPPDEWYKVAVDAAHTRFSIGTDFGAVLDAVVEALWAAAPPSLGSEAKVAKVAQNETAAAQPGERAGPYRTVDERLADAELRAERAEAALRERERQANSLVDCLAVFTGEAPWPGKEGAIAAAKRAIANARALSGARPGETT